MTEAILGYSHADLTATAASLGDSVDQPNHSSRVKAVLDRILPLMVPPDGALELVPGTDQSNTYRLCEDALGVWIYFEGVVVRVYHSHGEGVIVDLWKEGDHEPVATTQLWFGEAAEAVEKLAEGYDGTPGFGVRVRHADAMPDADEMIAYLEHCAGRGALSPRCIDEPDPEKAHYRWTGSSPGWWIEVEGIDVHGYVRDGRVTVELLPADRSDKMLGHALDEVREISVDHD